MVIQYYSLPITCESVELPGVEIVKVGLEAVYCWSIYCWAREHVPFSRLLCLCVKLNFPYVKSRSGLLYSLIMSSQGLVTLFHLKTGHTSSCCSFRSLFCRPGSCLLDEVYTMTMLVDYGSRIGLAQGAGPLLMPRAVLDTRGAAATYSIPWIRHWVWSIHDADMGFFTFWKSHDSWMVLLCQSVKIYVIFNINQSMMKLIFTNHFVLWNRIIMKYSWRRHIVLPSVFNYCYITVEWFASKLDWVLEIYYEIIKFKPENAVGGDQVIALQLISFSFSCWPDYTLFETKLVTCVIIVILWIMSNPWWPFDDRSPSIGGLY